MALQRFERLSQDKMNILTYLTSSYEITQAIGCDEIDFLNPDFKIENPDSLIMTQIFPYKYVPPLNENKSTFLTLGFENYVPVRGQQYKNGIVAFYIMSHNDKQQTDYGFLRPDYITHKIDQIFDRTYKIGGIGKVQFAYMNPISINEKYHGNKVAYEVYEWM